MACSRTARRNRGHCYPEPSQPPGAPASGGGPPSPPNTNEEDGRGDEGGRASHGDGGAAAACCGRLRGGAGAEKGRGAGTDGRRWPTASAGGAIDGGADRV